MLHWTHRDNLPPIAATFWPELAAPGRGRGTTVTQMTRHFGVLIPSTNTTVEMESRLLPVGYQAHFGRLGSASGETFTPSLHARHLLG
jgi:hypothetical protein